MEHTHPILLELVRDRLWHGQQLLKFGPIRLATRMSIVRLADGSLWVHSPIAPHADLVAQIAALGSVGHVVAPNKSHHLFFLPFLQAFPGAHGWVAPGLGTKRPDLTAFPELDVNSPWAQELTPYFIEGIPLLNETVWFHHETGTLVMTDLLFCIAPNPSWLVRTAARLLGIQGRPGMSRTMKLAIKDRAALAASVAPLLSLPVQRIVLAHDAIVTDGAQEKLQHAFEFLKGT
jgi:hypothetical protein